MQEFLEIFHTGTSIFTHIYLFHDLMADWVLLFTLATLSLGVTRQPTAHLVFKHMKMIEKHLKNAIELGPIYISNLVKPMLEKYDKYWDQMNDFCTMNVVLDPWCKLELIKFVLSDKLNSSEVISYVKSIRKNLAKWFEEMTKFSNKGNPTSASHQDTALCQKIQGRTEDKEQE
jgi:hypothetical protein